MTTKKLEAPKPKEGEKTLSPKEAAAKLKVDAKRLRAYLRTQYGTHYERWAITPAMLKDAAKHFAKKA